jgi:uncharacterized protein YkwD
MISKYAISVFAAVFAALVAGSSAIASEKLPASRNDAVPTCGGRTIGLNAEEKRSLELHNAVRRAKDLKPFCVNAILTDAARAHARDMLARDYFAHNSPEGATPIDLLKRSGYLTSEFSYWTVGENIAWGSGELGTPKSIFGAWLDSDGHRHNILDGDFRQIGIGVRRGDYTARNGRAYEGSRMYAVEFGARREKSR